MYYVYCNSTVSSKSHESSLYSFTDYCNLVESESRLFKIVILVTEGLSANCITIIPSKKLHII